jgi:hypothetical protein
MFATTQQKTTTVQRSVCMLLAALIVTTGLATGAFGIHMVERDAAAALVKQA